MECGMSVRSFSTLAIEERMEYILGMLGSFVSIEFLSSVAFQRSLWVLVVFGDYRRRCESLPGHIV